MVLPGLLQTEEYARAVLRQVYEQSTPERVNTLVEVRMRRQGLLDQADPPQLFFILDEATVRRVVGGQAVMLRQVRRLTEMADRPNVTVEVVPFTAGYRAGMDGSFVILEFSDAADDPVVYLERSELVKEDLPEDVVSYREQFEQLRRMSLGPAGTLAFLKKITDEMK